MAYPNMMHTMLQGAGLMLVTGPVCAAEATAGGSERCQAPQVSHRLRAGHASLAAGAGTLLALLSTKQARKAQQD